MNFTSSAQTLSYLHVKWAKTKTIWNKLDDNARVTENEWKKCKNSPLQTTGRLYNAVKSTESALNTNVTAVTMSLVLYTPAFPESVLRFLGILTLSVVDQTIPKYDLTGGSNEVVGGCSPRCLVNSHTGNKDSTQPGCSIKMYFGIKENSATRITECPVQNRVSGSCNIHIMQIPSEWLTKQKYINIYIVNNERKLIKKRWLIQYNIIQSTWMKVTIFNYNNKEKILDKIYSLTNPVVCPLSQKYKSYQGHTFSLTTSHGTRTLCQPVCLSTSL